MQQMYSCPNCGTLAEYGQQYCASCGASFDWNMVPDPPQSQYDYQQQGGQQYNQQYDQQYYEQQDWNQQSAWNQPYPEQQSGWNNAGAYQHPAGRPVHRRVPAKKGTNMWLVYAAIFLGVVFVGSTIFLLFGDKLLTGNDSGQGNQAVVAAEPGITFSVVPDTITAGESAELKWNVSGADSVSIDNEIGSVAAAGVQSVSPVTTTVYTLTASNSIGTVTKSATLNVSAAGVPQIVSFAASPTSIDSGGSSTLQWSVTGASGVTLNDEAVAASGSKSVFPSTTTTYILAATNSYGTVTESVTVTIGSNVPVITSFTASPSSITSGGTSTLSWQVDGATSVSINQSIGIVSATSGSESVSPTSNTTYTLTATNDAGSSTATATVTIVSSSTPPVIVSYEASPLSIVEGSGSYATLSWEITGATSVTINDTAVTPLSSGTYQVSPSATTSYIIEATNSKGSVTDTVTVTVVAEGSPTINSFTATPTNISSGQSATLQWNVSDADSVSISPNVGVVSSTSGTVTVSPTSTTTYTLTATNSYGSVPATVRIVVATGIQFTASPSTITQGDTSTLQWSVIGATSVYLDPPGLSVNNSGYETVTPETTTQYTLTADSLVAYVTVTVLPSGSPTITSFTATYDTGDTYILAWEMSDATSASISPTVGTVTSLTTGSVSVTVTTQTTFTLSATNSVGTVTKSVTVTP